MKTNEDSTKFCYDQGYNDALADVRHYLSSKAALIDKLLYSDEAMNILDLVSRRKFDKLMNMRKNLRMKSKDLWRLAGYIYEEEVKHAL